MKMPIKIAPSILSANFSCLAEEIKAVEQGGADMIHLDVMDGHFVPNLTFGAPVVKKLRPCTQLPFDVHLMVKTPDIFLKSFADAGANIMTVHPEAGPHIYRTLQAIKSLRCQAGVALNPGTPVEVIEPLMEIVDLILVMTVNPGFGGQAFLDDQIDKIIKVRQMIDASKRLIQLEVDGGLTPDTAKHVIKAGADILVAGTAVFKGGASHYSANIQALRGH